MIREAPNLLCPIFVLFSIVGIIFAVKMSVSNFRWKKANPRNENLIVWTLPVANGLLIAVIGLIVGEVLACIFTFGTGSKVVIVDSDYNIVKIFDKETNIWRKSLDPEENRILSYDRWGYSNVYPIQYCKKDNSIGTFSFTVRLIRQESPNDMVSVKKWESENDNRIEDVAEEIIGSTINSGNYNWQKVANDPEQFESDLQRAISTKLPKEMKVDVPLG